MKWLNSRLHTNLIRQPASSSQALGCNTAWVYAPLRGSIAPAAPYARFVQRWGKPALELGCGHGEPLLELVAAGLDVTGLDSSADMLELCRNEAQRRGLRVQLVCQSMQAMDIGRRFRSIYLAGPTFQLIIDLADVATALHRIAAHLTPGGRALIPLFTPQPADPATVGVWREQVTADGDTLAVRTVAESYRLGERRVDSTLEYRRGPSEEPIELVERTWSLRWYDDGEFEALASTAGLVAERTVDHGELGRSVILSPASVA